MTDNCACESVRMKEVKGHGAIKMWLCCFKSVF